MDFWFEDPTMLEDIPTVGTIGVSWCAFVNEVPFAWNTVSAVNELPNPERDCIMRFGKFTFGNGGVVEREWRHGGFGPGVMVEVPIEVR